MSPTVGLLQSLEGLGVGVEPMGTLPAALPENEEQVAEVLALARAEHLRVVPVGLGGKLGWCRPEALEGGADLALSTRRLNAVSDYVAGDGTLTAQAGCRMADLAATVAQGGHRLTPDVPRPEAATLGGVLGASQSGADRLRHGPVRDHVLGMRVLLADGTPAKSGGKLVKNVTGFDLHRLYTGSRGTLCVVLEASLRLFPSATRDVQITVECSQPRDAWEAAAAVRALAVRALAITVENRLSAGWRVHVALSGGQEQLEWERDQVLETLGSARDGAQTLEGADARAARASLRDGRPGAGAPERVDWPHLRLSCLPSRIGAAVETCARHWDGHGQASVVAESAVAVAGVWLAGLEDLPGAERIESLLDLRKKLAPAGVRLVPAALPAAVHLALAPPADGTPARAWMRRIAEGLDPEGRLACPSFPSLSPSGSA